MAQKTQTITVPQVEEESVAVQAARAAAEEEKQRNIAAVIERQQQEAQRMQQAPKTQKQKYSVPADGVRKAFTFSLHSDLNAEITDAARNLNANRSDILEMAFSAWWPAQRQKLIEQGTYKDMK